MSESRKDKNDLILDAVRVTLAERNKAHKHLPDSPTRDSHPVGGEEDATPVSCECGWCVDCLHTQLRSLRSSLATVSKDRDRLWCTALIAAGLDTYQIERVTTEAIKLRDRAPRPEETGEPVVTEEDR